jgi:hypothetical protein
MDTEKAIIIVAITLAIVFIINAGILVTFLRSRSSDHFKVLGKAIQAVRDPFRDETESLTELRDRVSKLEPNNSEELENGS